MAYVTYDWRVGYTTRSNAGTRYMTVEAPYSSEAEELVRGMVPGCRITTCLKAGNEYHDGELVGNANRGGSSESGELAASALGFLGAGLWAGVKGIGNAISEAGDEIEEEEAKIKAQGKDAWEAYQKKDSRNQRIFWFLSLGSLSCLVPALGMMIYMFGFGPYWGNKAGDAICKKKGIENKFVKYILIGVLMIPVGMPVGIISHTIICNSLGINPAGWSSNKKE